MVLHEEQERVKTLLTDTITLLCRNGLTFKSEFNISALIGITLDKDNVFLVDIRETIKNSVPSEDADSDASSTSSTERLKRKRRRRKRLRESVESANSGSDDEQEPPEKQSTASADIKQEAVNIDDEDSQELVFVKNEPATMQAAYPSPGFGSLNQDSFSASAAVSQGNSSQFSSPIAELPSAIPPSWESFQQSDPPGSQPSSMQQTSQHIAIPSADPSQSPMMIKPVQTRRTHSVDKRYAAIKDVEEGVLQKTLIAKKYNIPQNTLSTWIKNAAKIKEGYEKASYTGMLKMRPGSYPDVEKALKEWVILMEGHGQYVSSHDMRGKAQQIALSYGHNDFKGSNTWLRQFKRRNGWVKRRRSDEAYKTGFNRVKDPSSKESVPAEKLNTSGELDSSIDETAEDDENKADPETLPPQNILEQVHAYTPTTTSSKSATPTNTKISKPVTRSSTRSMVSSTPSTTSSESNTASYIPGTSRGTTSSESSTSSSVLSTSNFTSSTSSTISVSSSYTPSTVSYSSSVSHASDTRSYTPDTCSYTPATRSYTPDTRSYTPDTHSYTPGTLSYTPTTHSYTTSISSYTSSSYTTTTSSYMPGISSYLPGISSYTASSCTYPLQQSSYATGYTERVAGLTEHARPVPHTPPSLSEASILAAASLAAASMAATHHGLPGVHTLPSVHSLPPAHTLPGVHTLPSSRSSPVHTLQPAHTLPGVHTVPSSRSSPVHTLPPAHTLPGVHTLPSSRNSPVHPLPPAHTLPGVHTLSVSHSSHEGTPEPNVK